MSHRSPARRRPALLSMALAALLGGAVYAHTFVGLQHGTLARARVQSPNALAADFPIPIPGTDLSTVCFKVRNTSTADSRITAIGLDLPGDPSGFTLVTPTDGRFHLMEQVAHVPELPDVTLDVALVTGSTFAGGRPSAGLAPSATTSTDFCVIGPFDRDIPIERLLDRGVLRFQSVGQDGELGDISVWESGPFLNP